MDIQFDLLKKKKILYRLDVWPFLFIYGGIMYIHLIHIEEESDESMYSKLIVLGILFAHALTFLLGHWSNKLKKIIQYSSVSLKHASPFTEASHIYVTHIKKKGRIRITEICELFCQELKENSD